MYHLVEKLTALPMEPYRIGLKSEPEFWSSQNLPLWEVTLLWVTECVMTKFYYAIQKFSTFNDHAQMIVQRLIRLSFDRLFCRRIILRLLLLFNTEGRSMHSTTLVSICSSPLFRSFPLLSLLLAFTLGFLLFMFCLFSVAKVNNNLPCSFHFVFVF